MSEAEQKRVPTSVEEIAAAMQFFSIAVASYDPNRPDHGRSGVRNALIAVIQLVAALFPNAPVLPLPLNHLLYGLADLDRGKVPPLLKRKKVPHSPGNPLLIDLFRALPSAAMTHLMERGVGREDAANEIAKRLNRLGYKLPGDKLITGPRIIKWREKLMTELARENLAVAQYQFALTAVRKFKDPVGYLVGLMPQLYPPQIPKKG
jgi:hypothetical protein